MKIGIGARQAGLGGAFTGVGDDIYTIYWNPGGLGHLRRWQWSADYNRWFADIYQASITGAGQFRSWGTRKASIGFGCTYLGMPSWDATGGKDSQVSVNHLIACVSLGQRLDWISKMLSIGINIKGINSHLGDYSAFGVAFDAGFLLKSDRFELDSWGLGIFDYGIISAGGSIFHLGNGMKFDVETTSFPRTWRAGISLLVGKYRGWQLLLASDLVSVDNRDRILSLGTEVWWRDLVGVRLGYKANREDLGDFSFGIGFRWGDVINSIFGLPTRYSDTFELNVVDVSYGEVLQQTYRGTVSHYTIAPEPFRLEEPLVVNSQVLGSSSQVTLNWERTFDPDPFDQVSYLLLIDKEKSKVENAIRLVERDLNAFLSSTTKDSLLICDFVSSTSYNTSFNDRGEYFWAVAAYDIDHHARLAKRGRERVGKFIVATPDLLVRDVIFTPTPWITTTPEQGILSFVVSNTGNSPSEKFRFVVEDLFSEGNVSADSGVHALLSADISGLSTGEDTTFQIQWTTEYNGLHRIRTLVDPDSQVIELNRENNIRIDEILSVPKGEILSPDSIEVMATGFDSTEIPIVPEIYFDSHSSEIDKFYYNDGEIFPSILGTLSKRLQDNPDITIKIMGSIDYLSGEKEPTLANERAKKVKEILVSFGVPSAQIDLINNHPRKVLGKRARPVDSLDAKWFMEQNRVVTFSVPQYAEVKIFKPFKVAVDTVMRDSVHFLNRVVSWTGIDNCNFIIESGSINLTGMNVVLGNNPCENFSWDGADQEGILVPRNRWYQYSLSLTDTLGRMFKTQLDSIYLREKRTIWKREIFGAAKFARVEPVYQFYWDRLMDITEEMILNPTLHLRFEGHACAIGSYKINDQLSYKRASRFTNAFLARLRKAYPDRYKKVLKRIEQPVGFGEREPLQLKLKGQKKVLLGDNSTPVGRYLNRRIMVLLYKEN